jgi:hypothetical protein
MAYTINKTDGTVLATVADGTLDTTTNIQLIGKNYAGYGEILNENSVKLLENFASASSPDKPLTGQLYYDTGLAQIKVYNGTAFKAVNGAIISSTAPTVGAKGDMWYDDVNSQIYVYNGSTWVLVGPQATAGSGTSGAIVKQITDTTGVTRVVTQLMVSDSIVAIISSVEFTPQISISGFATIKKGVTLGTQITDNKFQGSATDADALGGIVAANYLRSDTNDTMNGTLTIASDSPLIIGADSDVTMTQSGSNFTLKNTTSDGNIIFNVNDGGSDTTVLTLTGSDASATVTNLTISGNLTVSGTTTTVNSTNMNVEDPILTLNKNASSIADRDIGLLFDRGINQNVAFFYDESADEFALVNTNEDGTTAGAISFTSYATLHATATAAQYSDLAERYEADSAMEPGDVVKIGGEKEITKTTVENDADVFGVISTDPAFKMNADAGTDGSHPYVALSGRVPCKVEGTVSKGQRLVSSTTPGVAKGVTDTITPLSIVGRALEDKTDEGVSIIEIVVGKN